MLFVGARRALLGVPKTLLQKLIASLFGSGQQGAVLDESDLSSATQDSAGATPVYAPGAGSIDPPVGKRNDKSGRGNHALQATAVNRPTLSARVNLIGGGSEDIRAAAGWTLTALTTPSALKIEETATTTAHFVQRASAVAAGVVRFTVRLKQAERTKAWLYLFNSATAEAWFDLAAGTVGTVTGTGTPSASISTINADGSYDCTLVATVPANANTGIGTATSDASENTVGVAGSGIFLTRMQIVQGSASQTYQQLTDANTYATAAFPLAEAYNGTNSSMAAAAGGGGSAGFFFCQAIKVTGNAGAIRTLWSDAGANTGYRVRINAANQLELSAGNGAAYTAIATVATLAVGTTQLVTAWDDGVNLNVQVDANTVASVARPAVSAGTAAFTIGCDNGAATNFFNGNMYPEVYTQGSGLTSAQRAQAQVACKSKAGL